MAFSTLKKNRDKAAEAIIAKMTAPTTYRDPRYWELKKNKDGNGSAIIRFLPAAGDETDAYITFLKHAFKNPKNNRWYIERSRKSLSSKEPDPAAEYFSLMWNINQDAAKIVRRANRFVANIYVISHPGAPEDEGKNFLYEYGNFLQDMIETSMCPEFEGVASVNPFDLWAGADLNLRFKKKSKNDPGNYELSSWAPAAPLFVDSKGKPDEDRMEEVYNREYLLQPELDESKYKSYDELLTRFNYVMEIDLDRLKGNAAPSLSPAASTSSAGKTATRKPVEPVEEDDPVSLDDDDEADSLFFSKLQENSNEDVDDEIPF